MDSTNGTIVIMLCVLIMAAPALADFYDSFGDLQYCQDANDPNSYDPNAWDLDNPHWQTEVFMATSTSFSAQNGALELWSDGVNLYVSSIGAYVDSGDRNPNSSDTWFDSTEDFYLLTHVGWPRDPNDPNDPNLNGAALAAICVDPNTWGCYGLAYNPRGGELILGSLTLLSAAVAQLDYADRSDLDPNSGVWMLLAHDVALSDLNDPNSIQKSLRGAVWAGDKFDWNGQYSVEYTYASDSNYALAPGLVHPSGLCGVATFGSPHWTSVSREARVSFDNVECRRGAFSNQSIILRFAVANEPFGIIDVAPTLPDANDIDPNMPYTMRYTLGTAVTLTATPNPEREFSYWQILDPNYPGDLNYGTTDSNLTLQLTMTRDTEVLAVFACGSGMSFVPLLTLLPVVACWLHVRRKR